MNIVDAPPVIRDGARMSFRCLDNTAEVIEATDLHEAVRPARAKTLIDLAELDLALLNSEGAPNGCRTFAQGARWLPTAAPRR